MTIGLCAPLAEFAKATAVLRFVGMIGASIGILAAPAVRAADQSTMARQFVEDVGVRVLTILSEGDNSSAARHKQFVALFVDSFDAPLIGRFVLGRHWDALKEDQRASYLESFNKYIVAIYAAQFATYDGEMFEITGSEMKSERDTLVLGEIKKPGEAASKIHFHVLTRDNSPKIVDIAVGGVSLIVTKRSEFGSVIQREGFESLKRRMDETIQRVSADKS